VVRILLVEDDTDLRRTLAEALRVEGFNVLTACSAADAEAQFAHLHREGKPDLVLLDLSLPDGDGADFLANLRARSGLPVIVISARHEEALRVQLLDEGADDYLTKPFSVPELFARIRVALRHRGTHLAAATTRYAFGDVVVELHARRVTRNAQEVRLTPTEWNLLARLVRNAGQVITHGQLLNDVWGSDFREHTHYLRLYMSQLRAKLEMDPTSPVMLLNEPGVGYRLAESA